MFLKPAECVWGDPGPFPYLEILREENQSEPKRLIDWLMFLDKKYKINGTLRFQTINTFSNNKVLFIIYPLGMRIYERIREEFGDSKT